MKTVMVTGGTGYIGAWVVNYLLEEGHNVHVTVRDISKTDKYAHLVELAEKYTGVLTFFQADLLEKGSYENAMKGCEEVFHLASPFFINNIKDAQRQLINPALEGTKNVLNAVNNTETVKKVILTSSVAAIYGDACDMQNRGLKEYTEEHWNTTSSLTHQPYSYSKLLAEKEAHKIHDAQNRWSLAVINPGFVMGPSLFNSTSSGSINFMKALISGKQKMGVPHLNFGMVDVRDVAKAHLMASKNSSVGRHIVVQSSLSMLSMANIIGEKFGRKYAIPKKELPKFMLYLFGWSQGVSLKFVSRNVGYALQFNNSKSKEKLNISYTPMDTSIYEMVVQMEAFKK